jgi:toxin ParE1/3/4
MPRSGRMVPEAGYKDAIREVIFQGYRIIYRIKNEHTVQIVTVLHGARDLANMQPPWQPPNNEP